LIPVTAAIIEKEGRILAARRAQDMHLAGFWEFPGGKLEEGESPEECLARELHEELGVVVRVEAFFAESVYDYGDKIVRLLAYRVSHVSGEFRLVDHDKLVWLSADELHTLLWAPADIPLVKKLQA
jgi:8-oxo-dGTP diphosphatase